MPDAATVTTPAITTETKSSAAAPVTTPPPAPATPAPEAKAAPVTPPAGASTLLGDKVNEAPPAAKAEGEKKDSQAEVKYDLALPKDALAAPGLVEKTVALSRERGLSQEQAKAVLEHSTAAVKEYVDSQVSAFDATKAKWLESTKAHPQYGGANLKQSDQDATRFLDERAPKGLKDLLVESGYAYHPLVFEFLASLGKASRNDKFVKAPEVPVTPKKMTLEDTYRQPEKKESAE